MVFLKTVLKACRCVTQNLGGGAVGGIYLSFALGSKVARYTCVLRLFQPNTSPGSTGKDSNLWHCQSAQTMLALQQKNCVTQNRSALCVPELTRAQSNLSFECQSLPQNT